MIPFNLTSTPAGLKQLKHEASTPGYSRYSETAAVLVDVLDRYRQRYESFVGEVEGAMDSMENVATELNDLCTTLRDIADRLEDSTENVATELHGLCDTLRDLADQLKECLVEASGDPDE